MKVDIAIMTIRENEFTAVRRYFQTERQRIPDGRTYLIGEVKTEKQTYTIAIARCTDQGSDASQRLAHYIIQNLDPQLILVVGIAGGVPHDEFTLGDVVVSTRIVNPNVDAWQADGTTDYMTRGGPLHPVVEDIVSLLPGDPGLAAWTDSIQLERPGLNPEQVSIKGDGEWCKRVQESLNWHFGEEKNRDRFPVFTAGPVISSNHLMKDPIRLSAFLKTHRAVLAVEMEAAGVYEAAYGTPHYPVMAIRGISDIVGLQRDRRWTAYACQTAAAFTYAFIMTTPIGSRSDLEHRSQLELLEPLQFARKAHQWTIEDARIRLQVEASPEILRRFPLTSEIYEAWESGQEKPPRAWFPYLTRVFKKPLSALFEWADEEAGQAEMRTPLQRYLDMLVHEYGTIRLPIGAAGQGFSLEAVFQPLRLYHPSAGEDFYRYRDESIFDDIAPSSLPVPVDQDEIVEHGFAALEKSDGRIVVLGGPGTGKSTLLKFFAGNQAKKLREQGNHSTISRNTPLPVFIILPDLVRSKKSLREYLATWLEEQFIDAEVADIVWEVIASGCAFVCLDSLDEVILQRDQLVQTLRRIIQGSGQGTRWVVSSRFTDYVRGEFEDGSLVEWELLPLDDTLRRQLAQHLIPELQKLIPNPLPVQDTDFLLALETHSRIKTWGKNPLLFSLAAILFVQKGMLPASRRELYLQVIDTIIFLRETSTWEIAQQPLAGSIARLELIGIMATLSYQLFMQRKGRAFLKDDLVTILEALRREQHASWETGIVGNQIVNTGIIERVGGDIFTFLHQTFQEYLAAYYFTTLPLKEVALRLHDPQNRTGLVDSVNEPFARQIIIELAHIAHQHDPSLEAVLYQQVMEVMKEAKLGLKQARREGSLTDASAITQGIDVILQTLVDLWGPRMCATLETGPAFNEPGGTEAGEIASVIASMFEQNPRKWQVPALIKGLPRYERKARFIGALGEIGTPEAQEALYHFAIQQMQLLTDLFVFRYITRALGKAQVRQAIPLLTQIRDNDQFDAESQYHAHLALLTMGTTSIYDENKYYSLKRVTQALAVDDEKGNPSDWKRVEQTAQWIEHHPDAPLVKNEFVALHRALLQALNHNLDPARTAVIKTLGKLGNADTFDRLLDRLAEGNEPSFDNARHTLQALVQLAERGQVRAEVRSSLPEAFTQIRQHYPAELQERIDITEMHLNEILRKLFP